jgi:Heparinase II/III-like protein
LGLDDSPGVSKTGLFRLHASGPSGKLFNFADGEEDHSGGYWLFWLAKRYRHPVDAGIELRGRKVHPMDLLWFDADGRDPSDMPTAHRFRAADVVMLRGSWGDPDTTYLGIKAGANDACEHGHYDLGNFVLDANGVRWAMDLGPDDYGLPGYFKPEMRSRYYRTSTIGHNTIVINGECQPPTARAIITHDRFEEGISFVVMDLSTAYPSAASARRGFALIDRQHVLIVDEIVPKARLSFVVWQMHTAAHVGLGNATAALIFPAQSDSAESPRFYVRVIDPALGTLSLRSAAPSDPQGQNPNTFESINPDSTPSCTSAASKIAGTVGSTISALVRLMASAWSYFVSTRTPSGHNSRALMPTSVPIPNTVPGSGSSAGSGS